MRVIAVVIALSVLGAAGSDRGREGVRTRHARIERLHWLAGCWERGSGQHMIEEQWMRPRGGSMLGMGRTVRGDSTIDYEMVRMRSGLPISTRGVRAMSGVRLGRRSHPSGDIPISVGSNGWPCRPRRRTWLLEYSATNAARVRRVPPPPALRVTRRAGPPRAARP